MCCWFLEESGISQRPEARVVLVGPPKGVEVVLQNPLLQNAIHALYLTLENLGIESKRKKLASALKVDLGLEEEWGNLHVYRKCLYCNAGDADVRLVRRWTPDLGLGAKDELFPDEFGDFNGHKFTVVAKRYFPYMDASLETNEPGSRLTVLDSLDTRIFLALARYLNFTFETWSTADSEFGVDKGDGNWTGMVGALQHGHADFSCGITPTRARGQVVDFSRVYIPEPWVIVSLKPQPPPQSWSLVRPLTGTVWLALVLSIFVFAFVLWLLQRAWSWVSGGRGLHLCRALMYAWGTTLEDPPSEPPANPTSRMLVVWWLMFCLVATTAYKSALIAHLTVQLESPPIDTFEDLLGQRGWGWGMSLTGSAMQSFLNTSPDPVIRRLGENVQRLSEVDRTSKVMRGKFAIVEPKYYIKAIVAKNFTNRVGYTPLHVGRKEYAIFAGLAFGYRRGAPFRSKFSESKQRMIEAGLMKHWIDDVFEAFSLKARNAKAKSGEDELLQPMSNGGPVVLSLHHLQGAFYLLFIGCACASFSFLGEKLLVRDLEAAQPVA
ncbi:probable glutamate receptor [Penaeus vannamei]|uniref:probable glutamate receptor n=1 Tax=Penaeus vannamei TaxID=6689 RepID=UPI00387F656C